MTVLKHVCFLFALLLLVAAASNVASFFFAVSNQNAPQLVVSHFASWHGRIYAFLFSIGYAAFGYGIHKRAQIIWLLGWPILALSYVNAAATIIIDMRQSAKVMDFADFWLPVIVAVAASAAVLIYWGFWWKRQKGYFRKSGE